jgi:putative ABC transport system permease protein
LSYLNYLNTDIFHINLHQLVAMATLFSGFTLALLLFFAKREGQAANLFLSAALVVIVVKTGGLSPIFLPALGPLLYFYVRRMTLPKLQFSRKDVLHFCPLLVAYWMPDWLVLILVVIYLYLSHRLIQHFYKRLQPVLMDRPRFAFRRLNKSLHLLVLLCLFWLFNEDFSFTVALVLIGMSADLILKLNSTAQLDTPITDRYDAREKSRRLREAVAANRLYVDAELTLTSLGLKLNIHPHELSRIINVGMEKNFSDFINEFRVRETARKMHDPAYDRLTLLGIAYESGFNSQRTFNRVFKEMTGKTPVEYKNNLKKESPNDKLAIPSHLPPVSLRSGSPLSWTSVKLNRNHMFKNYLKTSWRSLLRHKSYTMINVTGLTVGIAAALLIFLVVQYETSFDNFHSQKEQIFRVTTVTTKPAVSYGTGIPFPMATSLRLDMPQLAKVAAILRNEGSFFNVNNQKFKEDETYYIEPAFFKTFNFKWLAGDAKTSLAEPNTVALTKSEANKFFGDWRKAIGQTISYKSKTNLKVTGILDDLPPNTDFPIQIAMSYATMQSQGGDNFGSQQNWGLLLGENYCFVTLPKNANISAYQQQFNSFLQRHMPNEYQKSLRLQLQPLTEMHFDNRFDLYTSKPFSKQLISAISLIALFLVIIACVNFINLATAQAVNRSKEVGIRKVLGSRRQQLIIQFMSETGLITLISIFLSIIATLTALPFLTKVLSFQLTIGALIAPSVIGFLMFTWLAVTLLSGFYPALVLSGFNPITALKNKFSNANASGVSLRRGLVVFQFCIAQVLIIGTLVMISQLNYFKNKSLGFNQTAMVTVNIPNDSLSRTKFNYIKRELQQIPHVKGISLSSYSPVDDNAWFAGIQFDHAAKETEFGVSLKWADADFFKVYGLQFLSGHAYAASDTVQGYVINETLMHKLNITDPQQAIGKNIGLFNNKRLDGPITGVVKDYNVSSLKDAVPPVIMMSKIGQYGLINMQIAQNDMAQTFRAIENKWTSAFPDALFEYHFIDEQVAKFYKADNQLSLLYQVFAGIAILISCLGLFGLVSFMAVQRTKEVGIRKTLGASVSHIVYLFSKEFTILVFIAFAISAPIGAYLTNNWLQSYSYRIDLGPGIFALALLLSITIAWLTVGYKAVRAALVNPVKSLKSE